MQPRREKTPTNNSPNVLGKLGVNNIRLMLPNMQANISSGVSGADSQDIFCSCGATSGLSLAKQVEDGS